MCMIILDALVADECWEAAVLLDAEEIGLLVVPLAKGLVGNLAWVLKHW